MGSRKESIPPNAWITLLVDDLHIRIIDRHTGELLRELTLDPSRDFQPRGGPPGPPKKTP